VKNSLTNSKEDQSRFHFKYRSNHLLLSNETPSVNIGSDSKLIKIPVILIISYYLRPWEILPFLSIFHLSAVLSVGTIVWFFMSKKLNRDKYFDCKTSKWILYLFIGLILSMPLTLYSSRQGIENFLPAISIYIALTVAIRSRKDLLICLYVLIFCMDIHAISVAKAYFTGAFTDRVTGFVSGEFIGANSLGAFFVLSLPISFYLWSEASIKLLKLLALLSIVLLLTGLLATQSRGGLMGLSSIIFFSIIFSQKRLKTFFIYVGILCLVLPMIPKEKFERYRTLNVSEGEEIDPSSASRIYAWEKGLEMFLDYPIAGVGVRQFSMAFGKKYRDAEWGEKFGKELGYNAFLQPHNIFIQVIAETGSVGFIAFLMIIYHSIRSAWRVKNENGNYELYAKCLIVSAFAYLTSMLFDHHAFATPTYTLFALLVYPENSKKLFLQTK